MKKNMCWNDFLPRTDYSKQEKCREIIESAYWKKIIIFMDGDRFL